MAWTRRAARGRSARSPPSGADALARGLRRACGPASARTLPPAGRLARAGVGCDAARRDQRRPARRARARARAIGRRGLPGPATAAGEERFERAWNGSLAALGRGERVALSGLTGHVAESVVELLLVDVGLPPGASLHRLRAPRRWRPVPALAELVDSPKRAEFCVWGDRRASVGGGVASRSRRGCAASTLARELLDRDGIVDAAPMGPLQTRALARESADLRRTLLPRGCDTLPVRGGLLRHGDDPNPGLVGELVSHSDTYAPSQRAREHGARRFQRSRAAVRWRLCSDGPPVSRAPQCAKSGSLVVLNWSVRAAVRPAADVESSCGRPRQPGRLAAR